MVADLVKVAANATTVAQHHFDDARARRNDTWRRAIPRCALAHSHWNKRRC